MGRSFIIMLHRYRYSLLIHLPVTPHMCRVVQDERQSSYCFPSEFYDDLGYTLKDMFLCKEEQVPIYYANDTTITTWRNNGGQIYQKGTETRNMIYIL